MHVQVAAAKLDTTFPGTDIGQLVEQQPLLLLEDIDEAIDELQRYCSTWQQNFARQCDTQCAA